ncbi:MAG: hypothetical protein Q4C60_10500 [Eubacteriales bacterium]|nr:hypothetical protein [Eubacteriales bacterium]
MGKGSVFRDPLHAKHEKPDKEFAELTDLYDQYIEKFGSIDWDDFSAWNACTIEELFDLLRTCLKENKRMEYYRPEWYGECPPGVDL